MLPSRSIFSKFLKERAINRILSSQRLSWWTVFVPIKGNLDNLFSLFLMQTEVAKLGGGMGKTERSCHQYSFPASSSNQVREEKSFNLECDSNSIEHSCDCEFPGEF